MNRKAHSELKRLKKLLPEYIAEEDFYKGIIAALAVVNLHGQDTLFDNIVDMVDESLLLKIARAHGDMRWSGLDRWVKRNDDTPDYLKKSPLP